MPVTLNARIKDDGADTALARLAGRLIDRQPAMDEIGAELQASTHQRFREQRGPDGERWQALAPATLLGRAGKKARTKSGGFTKRARTRMDNAKILRDTGELFQSISFQASPSRVAVGTNKRYAAIHQFGGKAGRDGTTRIPARPFLGIAEADRQMITDVLTRHLEGR